MIELDHVSLAYRPRPSLAGWCRRLLGRAPSPVPALSDITLSVARGETLGVLGGNGSGKSTLLKLIAGLLPPAAGRCSVAGRVATLIELGAGFDPDYTGRQNLELGATLLGLGRAERRARVPGIAADTGLGADLDRPVREYSSGMFMRLAFCLATSVDADVLAIDEVLAVGDAAFRRQCQDRLARFRRCGGTLVIVSHDLAALSDWCPRVAWLERGRLRRLGPTHEVVREYLLATAAGPGGAAAVADRRARVEAVSVRDGAGRPRSAAACGDVMRIRLDYRLETALVAPTFGIMVCREDWSPCFGTNTALSGTRTGTVPPGTGSIDLVLDPLQLLPGRYLVCASIVAADGTCLDSTPALESFVVAGTAGEMGVFRPLHRWDLAATGRHGAGPARPASGTGG